MKKKNLVVLLILPFIISLLGVVTVNVTIKTFEKDILGIEWEYDSIEAFQIQDGAYRLRANAIVENNYPLAPGNELVWSVENKNAEEETHASILKQSGNYFLKTVSEGEITLTCSNKKGTVDRRLNGIVYKDGVIMIQTKTQDSQSNIDDTLYFGEYDFVNGKKEKASVEMIVKCAPTSLAEGLYIENKTENVSYDIANSTMSVKAGGDASLTLSSMLADMKISYTYSFNVVENGVNVYTYDDLLNCTNRSKEGEIVVLRKSFESLSNYNLLKKQGNNNVEIFGKLTGGKFDFRNDVYRTGTTYSKEFIKQWNTFAEGNSTYKKISEEIFVGLRVQKDFYGNGYTLNLHNLTYPYETKEQKINGETLLVPTFGENNLFRGPLPFYTLGDPNNMPLVSLCGQDNVGMYLDGDNITLNDVNLKNCDFGNTFSNLRYTGTVLEIGGKNVTVQNSKISNGKNVVRAFSADNAKIDNCMLSYAQNFLLSVGSNEILPIDGSKTYNFTKTDGSTVTATIDDYLKVNGEGDGALLNYMLGSGDKAITKQVLTSIQKALNLTTDFTENTANVTVNDTLFYRSGVASIAMESAFNGPFLYSKTPSTIEQMFKEFAPEGRNLVPYVAEKIAGVSAPVNLTVSGSTKFYDYKTEEDMDLSGLIVENISSVMSDAMNSLGANRTITIDDLFPLKSLLFKSAEENGQAYVSNGKKYVNVPVAFYGGGLNLSTVTANGLENVTEYAPPISLPWIDWYLDESNEVDENSNLRDLKRMVQRMVTVVTGFEEFKFTCMQGNGYLYGEDPKVSELRDNVRG